MRRFLILLSMLIFWANSVYAVEFKALELPKQKQNTDVQEAVEITNSDKPVDINSLETPKGLLNDKEYKFKGKVEYDDSGVLFLNDDDIEEFQLKLKKPQKHAKKSVLSDSHLFNDLEEQKRYETAKVDEYLGMPFFGSAEYKAGKNITYGTTFGTELDTAQVEYRTKLFARYDNRFIGFMTAVGKDAYTSSGRQMDSFFLVPELKLGRGVSIVDGFKANPEYDRFRNEIKLQYRPMIKNSRENIELEAGMSQTSYYKSGDLFYQFSVSTKFRF